MTNFERFSNNHHIKAYNHFGTWTSGLSANYGYMSGAYTNTLFYPNDWQSKLLKNRDMKYLELPLIQRQELARIYKYREEIEYLQKIGNYHLASNIMFTGQLSYNGDYYSTVDMSIMTKKWLKRHKSLLKNSNKSFNDIMIQLYLQKQHVKRVDDISHLIHYKQLKKLPKEVKLIKFINYLKKHKFAFNYYVDYLNMVQELNTPLNDSILFPKNLQQAHDKAVNTINQLKRELKEQAYKKRLEQLKKFDKEIDDFIFVAPKDLQEIVREGNELHHCVGSKYYLDNHVKGETTIIFIRQKNDPQKPFFTLEYKNKRVIQIQGKQNREQVPKEVSQAVREWKKVIQKIS